jgi:hypothetical protein
LGFQAAITARITSATVGVLLSRVLWMALAVPRAEPKVGSAVAATFLPLEDFAPDCPKTARWRRWAATWLRQITSFL